MPDSAANEQTIGAYRLEEEIAADGAGVVYRARHLPTAQPVAIRMLPPDMVTAPDFRERFEREMRTAAALYHPHITELYEFRISEGRAFIVSELPSDGFLRDAIRRRMLPLRLSVELARQAAVGLSVAHARGVVHGALTPERCALFAGPGGSYLLKVSDFGIARLIAPVAAVPAVYQAPELRAGGDPDPSADCYALGAMLYEMIVGSPPPPTSIPPLRTLRPEAPANLEALVARCLASDPSQRFGQMSELAEALGALVVAMGEQSSVAAADEPTVIEQRAIADDVTVAAHAFASMPDDMKLIAPVPSGEGADAPERSRAPGHEDTPREEGTPPEVADDVTVIAPVVAGAPSGVVADAPQGSRASDREATQEEVADDVMVIAPVVVVGTPPEVADDVTVIAPVVAGAPSSAVADATAALLADTASDEGLTVLPSPSVTPQQPSARADVAAEAPSVVPPDEAVTILPESAPAISTPLPQVSATQSLMVATPPPGFPALPPPSSMPQVQLLDNAGAPLRVISLTGDGLAIGRAESNDLQLPDDTVSEEHAFIDWDGRQVTITDLGSKNGTFVAGVCLPPQERYPWQGGAPVRIGVYWLRLIPPLVQAASMVVPVAYGIPAPEAVAAPPQTAGAPPPRTPAPVTPSFDAPVIPPTAAPPSQAGITQMPAPGTPQSASPQSPIQPTGGSRTGGVGVTQPPLSSNRYGVELEQDVMTLTPGMPAVLRMTLHNYSDSVDHLRVEVQGVPETWIQGPTPEPQLLPNGRAPVALNINVPRTPENRAGPYPVTIYARSRSRPNEAGAAQATWSVQAFTEHRLELKPRRAAGWRKAHYNLTLTNAGNVPMRYTLVGEDDEQALSFNVGEAPVALEPSAAYKHRLTVQGPIRWLGSSQPRSFSVQARTEKRSETQTSSAQFIQRALIPTWLIPLALLAFLAILYFVTLPPVIRNPRFERSPQIAGQPARLIYEIDNAQRVELLPLGVLAPADSGRRTFEFLDATAIPPDLSILAISRFGIRAEASVAVAVVTPTPTPEPTATPPPPTVQPTPETLPAPTEAPPVPPPAPPPVTTPTPEVSLAELVRLECRSGERIVLTGAGPPRESFLLYFGRRAVSGGSVAPNGIYRIEMLIGPERPGEYPVSVRLRLGDRPLPIRTYQYGADRLINLSDASPTAVTTELLCVVQRAEPTPTIAP